MQSSIKKIILRLNDTKKVIIGYFKDLNKKRDNLSLPAKNLKENGFHIFSDILDPEEVENLKEDFSNLKKKFNLSNKGQDKGRISTNGLLTSKFKFLVDKTKNIVDEFFGSNSRVEISYYQEDCLTIFGILGIKVWIIY